MNPPHHSGEARIRLGHTDIEVSPLCMGTHQLGGDWGPGIDGAKGAIRYARDQGINFFDTAYSYGWGTANRQFGETLHAEIKNDRSDLVLCAKVGLRRDNSVTGPRKKALRDTSPEFLRASVETVLSDLGTDHVDVLMLHYPDPSVALPELSDTLQDIVASGQARCIGLSNFTSDEIRQMSHHVAIDVVQFPLSLFSQSDGMPTARLCAEEGWTGMAWAPLAQGFLTDNPPARETLGTGDYRAGAHWLNDGNWGHRVNAAHQIREIAHAHNATTSQVALAWLISRSPGTVPVFGAQNADQVADNLGALRVDADDDLLESLEVIGNQALPMTMMDAIPR